MLRTVSVRRVNSAKVTFQVEFGFSCTIIFFQDRLVIWVIVIRIIFFRGYYADPNF